MHQIIEIPIYSVAAVIAAVPVHQKCFCVILTKERDWRDREDRLDWAEWGDYKYVVVFTI